MLEDLDPTPSPPSSSQEDDASASDSDFDEEAAAWWRREHGDAAVEELAPAARNRPAAADRQDDARWEGPMDDGDRQPPRRRPPPSSKRKTLYDVLGVAVEAPRGGRQARLPRARPAAPPGQVRLTNSERAVQGGPGGLRDARGPVARARRTTRRSKTVCVTRFRHALRSASTACCFRVDGVQLRARP